MFNVLKSAFQSCATVYITAAVYEGSSFFQPLLLLPVFFAYNHPNGYKLPLSGFDLHFRND